MTVELGKERESGQTVWGLPDHGKTFGVYPRYDGKDFDGETQSDPMDCMNCMLKGRRIEISRHLGAPEEK